VTTTASPTIDRTTAASWLLVALWTGLVVWAGSDDLSAARTSRFLLPLIHWLMPEADFQTQMRVVFAIRKAAHLIEYAILAGLTWLALFSTYRRILLRFAGLALGWVATVAIFDEVRQGMIESRTGSGVDIAIDIAGGLLALALAIAYTRSMQRKRGSVKAE